MDTQIVQRLENLEQRVSDLEGKDGGKAQAQQPASSALEAPPEPKSGKTSGWSQN